MQDKPKKNCKYKKEQSVWFKLFNDGGDSGDNRGHSEHFNNANYGLADKERAGDRGLFGLHGI